MPKSALNEKADHILVRLESIADVQVQTVEIMEQHEAASEQQCDLLEAMVDCLTAMREDIDELREMVDNSQQTQTGIVVLLRLLIYLAS